MNNKKAEEEVSALITGFTLLGFIFPVVLVWLVGKIAQVAIYLEKIGLLERSERIVVDVFYGAGLDTGRLMIVAGVAIIAAVTGRYLAILCKSLTQ